MYNSANLVTTIAADATKYIYTVKLMRRINGFSFSSVVAAPVGTIPSTVTVQPPYGTTGTASSVPMTGNFIIKCTDSDGVVHSSKPISHTQWDEGIRITLNEMPYLRGRVRLYDTWTGDETNGWSFSYRENGRSLVAIFEGFRSNPPLCSLAQDTTNPTIGNNVQFVSEILRPYGQSLMFEPVGLEFLYSDAQLPQVLVNVDGLPALCMNLNCDYNYIASTGVVTAQSYDSGTKVITVYGTSLPTSGVTIHFGGVTCADGTATLTNTQYTCTLTNQPRAGAHKAEVRDVNGLLAHDAACTDVVISLVVTSSTPAAANALGGDTLTINGSGFPINKSEVTVHLEAGGVQTPCRVLTSSETVITCFIEKMSNEDRNNRTIKVSVANPRFITRRRSLQVVQTTDTTRFIGQTTGLPYITTVNGATTLDLCPITKQPLTIAFSAEYT